MSSNISINRTCQYCGNLFIAKTTVTRFCSHSCNSKHYKMKQREAKIASSNQSVTESPVQLKIEKDILTVKDACDMLGASDKTIYAMIATGRLKATYLGPRKIRILKGDLLRLFEQPDLKAPSIKKATPTVRKKEEVLSKEACYSIKDLVTLFSKNRGDLYVLLKRKKVPKIKVGKEVFFSKSSIDKLYSQWLRPAQLPLDKEREANKKLAKVPLIRRDCYSIDECVALFNKDRGTLYGIFNRRNVPKLKIGREVFLSKKSVDKILRTKKRGEVDYE